LEAVVVVAANSEEYALYESLLPLFFPRTQREAQIAAEELPSNCCCTEWGDIAVEDRKIRVSSALIRTDSDDDDDADDLRESMRRDANDTADRGFLNARANADEAAMKRLETTLVEAETPELARQVCIRYLRRAQSIRSEPEFSRFVYRAPRPDRYGRHVVVLLGARVPENGVRDARTLPLFVKELELLNDEHFILLYAHSDVSALDSNTFEVLQEMLAVINVKYRTALDQLLVLHPGIAFRAAFAVGRAMSDSAASLWHDTVYLENLADLGAFASAEQLGLPEYIRQNDPL